jgi:type IV pilus assembly protein PilN
MYSLDINFLNDRSDQPFEGGSGTPQPSGSPMVWLPVIGGALIGIVLPILMLLVKGVVENQGRKLTGNRDGLNAQLADLQSQVAQADILEGEVAQIEADIVALASVFSKVQPVSAIIQEISNRMPGGLQLDRFQTNAAQEATTVQLSGTALSYEALNDFLLVLRQSSFLDAEEVNLQASQRTDTERAFSINTPTEDEEGNAIDPELLPQITIDLPYVVEYQITAQLSDASVLDSDILEELRGLQAEGLVNRIEVLQEQGVINTGSQGAEIQEQEVIDTGSEQ